MDLKKVDYILDSSFLVAAQGILQKYPLTVKLSVEDKIKNLLEYSKKWQTINEIKS